MDPNDKIKNKITCAQIIENDKLDFKVNIHYYE